jgi:hypothetical protein
MESYITSSVAERQTISKSLKQELTELYNKMDIEKFKFQFLKTENSKNKRLLFLFQMDLLPGMTGEILNSKEQRDNVMLLPVSGKIKVISWVFLALLNFGMLFYVFLFAIRQNIHRQSAWAKSLAMYLFLDILLISSCMVIFMHILLPSIVMRDVVKIRKKLTETVSKYYHDLAVEQDAEDDEEDGSDGEEDLNNPRTLHLAMNKKYARKVSSSTTNGTKKQHKKKKSKLFNSAKYLFLSYRMAECYPDLKASKIILQYQSPWPRQSYQHTVDMKKGYTYSYTTALSRSVSIIVIFLLTSLLASPLAIQDMFLQMVATVTMGYMILLHIQLFRVFPVLVLVPSAVVGVVVMAGYLIYSSHYPSSDLLRKAQEEDDRSNSELSLTGSDEENNNNPPNNLKKVISPPTAAIIPIVAKGRVPPAVQNITNNNNNNKQQQTRRQSMQYGLQLTSQIKDILSDDDEDDDDEEEEKEEKEEAEEKDVSEDEEQINRQGRRHSHSKTKENNHKKKKTEIESKESDDKDSEENRKGETKRSRKTVSSESEEKERERDEEDDEEDNHSAFNSDISDENFDDEQDVLITKFLSIKMGNDVEEDELEVSDDEEGEEEEEQSRNGTERSQSRRLSSSNHSSSHSRHYSSSDRRKESILSQSEGKETRSDEEDHDKDDEEEEAEEEQEDQNSSEEKLWDNSSEDHEKDNRSVESMQSSSSEEIDSEGD